MNILSLFDGISCGRVALERAGIPVDKYYASEIDKYATQISEKNYPDIIRLGDVTKWNKWDVDWASIDLVIGGSPCTGFSFAGKQLAFDDPRSALFFEFENIVNHVKKHNPKMKFLLENVRMKKEYLNEISKRMGVESAMINSALVSAQNRVRFYWANWEFGQPKDKGILLKDIIETGDVDRDKSLAVITSVGRATPKRYLEKHQNQMVITGGAMRGRYLVNGKRADNTVTSQKGLTTQRLELRKDGKSNNLSTVQKDSLCVQAGEAEEGKLPALTTMGRNREPKIAVEQDSVIAYDYYNNRIVPSNKAKTLGTNPQATTAIAGQLVGGPQLTWRKLTPLECERLQTLPDGYTEGVSNTQRYKALGNGWTVDVIAYIFRQLIKGAKE